MKIRKLQLKNIGVFDDETIEFKECPAKDKAEIHILTGENGSGKTTILMALASAFRYLPNFHKEKESLVGFTGLIDKIGQLPAKNEEEEQYKQAFGNMFDVLQERLFEPDRNKAKADEFCKRFRFFEIEDGIAKSFVIIDDFEIYGCPQCGDIVHSEEVKLYNKLSSEPTNSIIRDYEFSFAAFVYSGYRRIKDEPIEIGKENNENPLFQALNFVKDESSKFNVNQWLGQNLLNNSLAQTKKKLDEAKIFDEKIKRFEKVINDIIADETKDNEIRFEMQSAIKLVLIKNEQELDFDVLPDGLKSLISWIGDLLMRLDSLKWKDDTPIFDREIILFLDEIEVHLHPAWQRKVLPIVQKLFKNAQIFVSTHSPFVVNSVDDAWVYKLKVTDGKAKVESVTKSEDGNSYSYVLEETFDINEEFGIGVQKDLENFKVLRNQILSSTNGTSKFEKDIKILGRKLAEQSEELNTIVQFEIRQINRRKGTELTI
jgi:energy-coupling factor transporter ATP-binding protein EcfA2